MMKFVVFYCRSGFRSGIIMQFVQRELPTTLGLISSRTKDTFLEHLWRGYRWSHAQWDDNAERSFRHDDYRLIPNDYCKLNLDIQSCAKRLFVVWIIWLFKQSGQKWKCLQFCSSCFLNTFVSETKQKFNFLYILVSALKMWPT